MASAVGMAAIRIWPDRPCRAARISSRMVRVSPTMRRAQASTCWPSGVRPWKREPRSDQHADAELRPPGLADRRRKRRLRDAEFLRRPGRNAD
jgi:hypothetical protein